MNAAQQVMEDAGRCGRLVGSAHYVEGRRTKEENPHLYRMATYGKLNEVRKLSPYVQAWLDSLPDPVPADDDVALAVRLAALPDPPWLKPMLAYRTHAQLMSSFNAELDRANKKKPPIVWRPLSEETRRKLENSESWPDKSREKSTAAARKRGDIVQLDAITLTV